jgi:vacuolar protein sorting-associated protein 35
MAAPQAIEDQGILLENALGSVRMHTAQMRRCLNTPGKLMDALKCA